MMVSEEHARKAFLATLAEAKAEVVKAWTVEKFPQVRERLWNEHQAIERIEETISAEFGNIIRRAAGLE